MSFKAIKHVVEHSQAKGAAKLVLMLLAFHENPENGVIFPSLSTLAREAGLWRSRVAELISELEKSGELSHHNRIGPQGGTTSNSYMIHLSDKKDPVRSTGHPSSRNMDTPSQGERTLPVHVCGYPPSAVPDAKGKRKKKEKTITTTSVPLRGPALSGGCGGGGSLSMNECTSPVGDTSPASRDSVNQAHGISSAAISFPAKARSAQPPNSAVPPSQNEDDIDEDTFVTAFGKIWAKTSDNEIDLTKTELGRVKKLLHKFRSDWQGIGLEGLLFRFAFGRYAWNYFGKDVIKPNGEGEHNSVLFPCKFSQEIGLFFSQLGKVRRWYEAHMNGAGRGGFHPKDTRNIVSMIARACNDMTILDRFVADNAEDYAQQCPEIGEERMKNGKLCRFRGYILGREDEKSAELWAHVEMPDPDEHDDKKSLVGEDDLAYLMETADLHANHDDFEV